MHKIRKSTVLQVLSPIEFVERMQIATIEMETTAAVDLLAIDESKLEYKSKHISACR
jgi:hypothetical protein